MACMIQMVPNMGHPQRQGLIETIERVERGLSEIIRDAQSFNEYLRSQGIGLT